MALLKIFRGGTALERMKSVGRPWLATLLIFAAPIVGAAPRDTPSAEYQVKSVFLFNFAQFVQWPAQAFHDAHSPLVIGVLGDDPFGDYLDRLTAGERIVARPIQVRRFKSVEEAKECQILFISRSESAQLDKIIGQLKGRSILTVGDSENFSRRGGMIRFVTESGKIRLRVDVDAAKDAELVISSKLLRPATIVTKEHD